MLKVQKVTNLHDLNFVPHPQNLDNVLLQPQL